MKKLVVALALVVATCGAFAQTTPAKPKHAVSAKADTTKKVTAVKKVHKTTSTKKTH